MTERSLTTRRPSGAHVSQLRPRDQATRIDLSPKLAGPQERGPLIRGNSAYSDDTSGKLEIFRLSEMVNPGVKTTGF